MLRFQFLFLITILYTSLLISQNLVPNGDFELFTSCPDGLIKHLNGVDNWLQATKYYPEYYNSCNKDKLGVPKNQYGKQKAKSGKGYAGLRIYTIKSAKMREYLIVELSDTLENNKRYSVGFSYSLGDLCKFACGGIGIGILANNTIDPETEGIPSVKPQFIFPDIMRNREEWITVQAEYLAKGNEKFLIIGNFTPQEIITVETFEFPIIEAYYYIDDVFITPIEE